jgi:dihydroflavonol-4-reductase
MSTVLVTGGSGFIGSHAILRLLGDGHEVRTTLRDLARKPEVLDMLRRGGAEPGERLVFFTADLEKDAGWAGAVAGCDYVLHIASPLPFLNPPDVDALVPAARGGALRVLRASRDAGVKRVVMTSSFAAIGYGHPPRAEPFDETDWTDVESPGVTAYVKSKTLAEQAAWEFIACDGGALELAVINPVGVFGPALGPDLATSLLGIKRLLDGGAPGLPSISFGVVDVRDVADLHVRAMTDPAAKGERFLALSGEFTTLHDVALILRRRLGPAARRVPTGRLPDWVVRLGALFSAEARIALPELGEKRALGAKAVRVLGWKPRSIEEAVVAAGESLIALGLVR